MVMSYGMVIKERLCVMKQDLNPGLRDPKLGVLTIWPPRGF